MMTLNTKRFVMASALMVALGYSCNKDRVVPYEELPAATAVESAQDNKTSDAMYTHVYTVVHTEVSNVEDQALKMENALDADPCAVKTIEVDSVDKAHRFVKKLTIDYGTAGCTWDGRVRKGRIIIVKQGLLKTTGTKCYISFDNFYIDGCRVEGNATYETGLTFKFDLTGGRLTTPDNKVLVYETHRTMDVTFVGGVFKTYTSGTASGTNHLGESYTVTTTKPVLFEYGCDYAKEGALLITCTGKPDITIDYGDGTCDDKSVITIGGTKYKNTL